MKSRAVDEVTFRASCVKCGVIGTVHATEIARSGAVTLFRASDGGYCPCGGAWRTEYQIAITADPENHPVMEIIPARTKVEEKP